MKEHHLFIDFENVQKIDLSTLPEYFHVIIFVGCHQKSIPFDLVQGGQHLGTRLKWLQIEGTGNNALDFHIAYYLGCHLAQYPKSHCVVLSGDSGFDPLLCHLTKKGFDCKRISSLSELESVKITVPQPKVAAPLKVTTPQPKEVTPLKVATAPKVTTAKINPPLSNYHLLLEYFARYPTTSRPGTRTALTNHIAHVFKKTLSAKEIEGLIDRLFKDNIITEVDGKLSYKL